jgi:hypothetical protein
MARRPTQPLAHAEAETARRREGRLEIAIAIALGLAAVVTAASVYLNEQQEHKATLDFHEATHRLIDAAAVGVRTPAGHALETISEVKVNSAEDHQQRAAQYTLAEVILATSLFLFGVAGISSRWRIRVGAFGTAAAVFVVALAVLATV